MTPLPTILAEIDAALAIARKAGPVTDNEAQAIRLEVIQSHRKADTYEHQWQPDRQLPPEPEPQQPINPGRQNSLKYERF